MSEPSSIEATTTRQFADETNLVKRQALFDFVDPGRSCGPEPLDVVRWSGEEIVLDAGCGNGLWTERLLRDGLARSVWGCDISGGMLRAAHARAPEACFARANLRSLPFRSASFDVVTCLWVLHLVGDMRRALQEAKRVLRPGGVLIAATNSGTPSLDDVLGSALTTVLGRPVERYLPVLTFNAETGADVLRTVFSHVEQHDRAVAFAIPTPEPVLASIASVRGPVEVILGESIDWAAVDAEARQHVEDAIARDGVFRRKGRSASFVCRA